MPLPGPADHDPACPDPQRWWSVTLNDAGKPVILYIAVCTECGASGTLNQVGGTMGQHGPTCPEYPHRITEEPPR